MYAEVALNIPAGKLFTYAVPENLASATAVGKRVFVPFGRRRRTGFIVALTKDAPPADVKPLGEILDEEPLFGKDDLKFYSWIADYFLYPLGKTLAELLPSGWEKKDLLWVTPAPAPPGARPTPAQKKLLDFLAEHPRGLSLGDLIRHSGLPNAAAVLRSLRIACFVNVTAREKKSLGIRTQKILGLSGDADLSRLTPRQQTVVDYLKEAGPTELTALMSATGASPSVVKKILEKGVALVHNEEVIRKVSLTTRLESPRGNLLLNDEQEKVLGEIRRFTDDGKFHCALLHGVTGSGKTEVYLCAIEHVWKTGGAAIYLVPEISLTPQLIARIAGRFDSDKIAVIHSGIPESVRYDQWREIRRGRISLVIGARSALFAPVPNLRLLIVDEEHDGSYKQDERLCYSARDLAVVKAKLCNAACVLGSATPGVRTFYNARTGKYAHLELTRRVNDRPLPRMEIVDMKLQKESAGKAPVLSDKLAAAIAETLARKEQALLFLNRRGFDTFLVCGDCGSPMTCPNCAVALKSHPAENLVKCHYCDFSRRAVPLCSKCGGNRILNYGAGTQKLEAELALRFPRARIRRMDADTTARKGEQEKMLAALERNEIDILVGTQMITKGHDFPFITLVGVISADTSLNMPDFRAAEKTFQMLTQVAGRGGRGDAAGRVVIQTFNPDHYVLRHARNHDYLSFYQEETEFRRALAYPPFSRLIALRLSSTREGLLFQTAKELGCDARALAAEAGGAVEIIGPAGSPLSKIRGEHRMQMLIKGNDGRRMRALAAALQERHATSTVKIAVDVDPDNFM
ncbi:MAG: primosomal protein N' [Deltaproteobacteria bacterium]|nr:primosomal protein N' [Deltaproteobacteria bacterium]